MLTYSVNMEHMKNSYESITYLKNCHSKDNKVLLIVLFSVLAFLLEPQQLLPKLPTYQVNYMIFVSEEGLDIVTYAILNSKTDPWDHLVLGKKSLSKPLYIQIAYWRFSCVPCYQNTVTQCTVGQTAAIMDCYFFAWLNSTSQTHSKNLIDKVISLLLRL